MPDTQKALELELDELVESGENPSRISQIIELLANSGPQNQPQEGTMALEITAAAIGATAELPAAAPESGIVITKEQLGIGKFQAVLPVLSVDKVKESLVKVKDTDDLLALVIPGVSVIAADRRIHVEERGEIRRVARGLAIALASGVQNGQVVSPNGHVHTVEDGSCFRVEEQVQVNSFTGAKSKIQRRIPCRGHLDYENTGTQDNPRFVATGREFMRCQHQWALMFAAGFFVTCSDKSYRNIVLVEIAQRVGDEDFHNRAAAQIKEWQGNAAIRTETRAAFSNAIHAEKESLGLGGEQLLPRTPEVLEMVLPDGTKLGDAFKALSGKMGLVTFTVPVSGRDTKQTVRARSLDELTSRFAPVVALAKYQKSVITLLECKAIA